MRRDNLVVSQVEGLEDVSLLTKKVLLVISGEERVFVSVYECVWCGVLYNLCGVCVCVV